MPESFNKAVSKGLQQYHANSGKIWNRGKTGLQHCSEEMKRKVSLRFKGKKKTEEHKLKISQGHLGKKLSMATRQKLREATIKQLKEGRMPTKETSIELKLRKEMERKGIAFVEQKALEKICIADFYIPEQRIVIFADGTYWHSSKKVKCKDINQDIVLGFKGYKVHRFTEDEINKSPENCIKRLQLTN